MSKAMHAKPFRLTGPYTGRHARPESPRSKLIRAVSLGLACVCLLLTATVYPASAATNSTSMASCRPSWINFPSPSASTKRNCRTPKRRSLPPKRWKAN